MTDEPKKTRTPKQNALEFRFNGIVRVPLKKFDGAELANANAAADAIQEALNEALPFGCEITFTDRRPGKMDVPPAEPKAEDAATGAAGEPGPVRKDIDLAAELPEAQRRAKP